MKLVNQQEKVLTSIGAFHPVRRWHQWMNMPICHFCAIWKKNDAPTWANFTYRSSEGTSSDKVYPSHIYQRAPSSWNARKQKTSGSPYLLVQRERERSEVPELALCLCHYKISAMNNTYSHFQFPFSANFRHADVFRELRTCRFENVCSGMECPHIRGR